MGVLCGCRPRIIFSPPLVAVVATRSLHNLFYLPPLHEELLKPTLGGGWPVGQLAGEPA